MSNGLKIGRPRRPARWYPLGTRLRFRDGREFVVDQREERYYDGDTQDESNYVGSEFTRYWRRIG